MDGLNSMAGMVAPIEIGGKGYRVRAWTIGDQGEVEAYIVSQRKDVMAELPKYLASIQEKFWPSAWEAAFRRMDNDRMATREEVNDFLHTMEGDAFVFWQCARDFHSEIDSLEKAVEIVRGIPLAEIGKKLAQCIGALDVENFTGSAPANSNPSTRGPRDSSPSENSGSDPAHESPGDRSTSDSPLISDGNLNESTD